MSNHHTPNRTLIIGLSGPSSSGKTTLARLLRSIFNIPASETTNGRSLQLFIFHQDDTYKTDTEIPTITSPSGRQLQDWDCADAIDLPLLEYSLQHIHDHGALPPALYSKEDQNSVGASGVPAAEIQSHQQAAASWLRTSTLPASVTLCILDGFLLYSERSIPPGITDQLDVKLFIRSDYARTKTRREARKGYVTLEGFWEDPDGYVEEVVWPNYVAEHKWMFRDGDVDGGDVEEGRVQGERGILVGPGKGETSMSELLTWCVGTVEREVGRILGEPKI